MATLAEQMQKMGQQVFGGANGGGGMAQMPAMPKPAAPATPGIPAAPQYDDSAASNLAKITASDSPLMKQAAATGLAMANRRGLVNSSIATGAAQGEVLKAATPIATADAAAGLQKNLAATQASSALDQIRTQGQVTGGLQQQQQAATSALSAQEATQLSALEKQRAAATSDQQRADIDAQMSRLKESNAAELTRLGAASGYEQQRLILAGQIDQATQAQAAGNQQQLAVLQGSIQSALQSQTDASAMQRLGAQYAQELTVQDRSIQGDLQKIAASGNEDVRKALVAAETARQQLAMQLASNDRTNAANTAVQVFQAEASIRANLLNNTTMPANERAAYEKAISSLGDPVRQFVNGLYSQPSPSNGLIR